MKQNVSIVTLWCFIVFNYGFFLNKLLDRRRQRANSTTIIFSIEASTNQERVGTNNKRFSWTGNYF